MYIGVCVFVFVCVCVCSVEQCFIISKVYLKKQLKYWFKFIITSQEINFIFIAQKCYISILLAALRVATVRELNFSFLFSLL